MKRILKTAIFFGTFVLIRNLFADSVTINNIEDTYIVMNKDSTPDHLPTLVVEGYDCSACIDQRALLKVDLGALSSSTVITKAELQLYSPSQPRPGAGIVRVYKVTKNWIPAEANWNNATATTRWSSAGGDFNSKPQATLQYTSKVNVWHAWDVTSLVKDLVAKPDSNFGIMLKMDPMMLTVAYASSNSPSTDLRPRLVVTTSTSSKISSRQKQDAKLAPVFNVSKSRIELIFSNNQMHSVVFETIDGKVIFNKHITGTSHIIPLSNIKSGLYVIQTNGIDGVHKQTIPVVK
jgi:hypothetical protein